MGNLSVETKLQETPGQMLKAMRETRQLSLNEVTQNLLLSKQVLIALENDDYSKISAEVYAEGYLKAYAKFLQLPVEDVLSSFHRLNLYSDIDKVELKSKDSNNLTGRKNQRMFIMLTIFLVLIALLLVMVKRGGKVAEIPKVKEQPHNIYSGGAINSDGKEAVNKENLPVVTTNTATEDVVYSKEEIKAKLK